MGQEQHYRTRLSGYSCCYGKLAGPSETKPNNSAKTKPRNYTLRFMPIPMYDASQALKTNPEKTEEALQKIENYLLRNHETRKYLQEQAYRLQQGIVTSTTQQMIDRICVKVQDHLNSLRNCVGDAVQEDLKSAERLMRDAKNSKTLLPNLYHVGGTSWAGTSGLLSGPIQETLESMAGEVTRVVDEQLKVLLESMVDAAEDLCPNVMKKAHIRQDLIHASTEKISIPRTFVKNVLLEQSGIDILNKISEVKLTVASFLSDRIVDEILDALSHCHHRLVSAVHIRSGTPSAVCRDAGQAPGWGCRFFPASYSFATLWPRSYFSSPTLLPDNSRIC